MSGQQNYCAVYQDFYYLSSSFELTMLVPNMGIKSIKLNYIRESRISERVNFLILDKTKYFTLSESPSLNLIFQSNPIKQSKPTMLLPTADIHHSDRVN